MGIKVDKDNCIGCGTCVGLCPGSFKLDDEGKAEVADQEDKKCATNASEACPTGAISVE